MTGQITRRGNHAVYFIWFMMAGNKSDSYCAANESLTFWQEWCLHRRRAPLLQNVTIYSFSLLFQVYHYIKHYSFRLLVDDLKIKN